MSGRTLIMAKTSASNDDLSSSILAIATGTSALMLDVNTSCCAINTYTSLAHIDATTNNTYEDFTATAAADPNDILPCTINNYASNVTAVQTIIAPTITACSDIASTSNNASNIKGEQTIIASAIAAYDTADSQEEHYHDIDPNQMYSDLEPYSHPLEQSMSHSDTVISLTSRHVAVLWYTVVYCWRSVFKRYNND